MFCLSIFLSTFCHLNFKALVLLCIVNRSGDIVLSRLVIIIILLFCTYAEIYPRVYGD